VDGAHPITVTSSGCWRSAIAKHETAHLASRYHDEAFAVALTEIDARSDEALPMAQMRLAMSS
jgi:hypothetical protein